MPVIFHRQDKSYFTLYLEAIALTTLGQALTLSLSYLNRYPSKYPGILGLLAFFRQGQYF